MTTLAYVGPIALDLLGDFQPDSTGDPNEIGLEVRFQGVVRKPVGESLKELCDNRDRRITFSTHVGVLEFIWVQNRPELFGPYLLQRCSVSSDHMQQLKGWEELTIDAVQLVDRTLVVARSARARTGASATSLVVQPFWGENPDGEPFQIDPGGTAFSREYDERTEYDPESLMSHPETYASWADPEAGWSDPDATWSGPTSRRLRIHAGTITS